MVINIGEGLSFELEERTIGVLGIKGYGKSHCVAVIIEETNLPYLVIDLIGAKPLKGNRITLGKKHKRAGQEIANNILKNNTSTTLDISYFDNQERQRFMDDFSQHLLDHNKTDRLFIIDEVQEVLPQRGACYSYETERLVRLGRNVKLHTIFTSQRPQAITKQVMELADILILFKLTYALSIKVIDELIQYQISKEERKDVLGRIQRLNRGECVILDFTKGNE